MLPMRLSVSLGLWLVGLSVLVLGVHGWVQLAEEEDDLYAAVARELTLVATAVRSTVENAVRDDQEADVEALLEQLELKDPAFDVFVFRARAELLGSSWGSATNLTRARALAEGRRDAGSLHIELLEGGDLAVVTPFRSGGRISGHIVILRPPNTLRADLRNERNAALLSIVVLAGILSAGVLLVLQLRLQRPISHMVSVVHRVARGDLSARTQWKGSDELAVLAREFDAMVESLERARLQLAHEAETRERLEGEMLRANRLAIVGELAATLAHEVGSPLQVLGGRARDMVRRDDLPDEVSRSATIIVEQVDRVHRIVENFLDVARRKAPAIEPVNLGVAVDDVVELLSAQARRKGVRFEVELASDVTVRADASQLQQVLLNLLQNALRASQRDNTVWVRASQSSFQRVPEGPMQPSVALSVEDEGPGLPDGNAEIVFQPFFTAWRGDSKHAAGTGLGLSVVRTIVTDHGGMVRAERRPNRPGARFVAHFPVVTDGTETEAER